MGLRRALLGLLALLVVALLVTLGLFESLERSRRQAFEEGIARVEWKTPELEELAGRYRNGFDVLELLPGGRLVLERGFWDDDVLSYRKEHGRWSFAEGRLMFRIGEESDELRPGRLRDEPVLVASARLWRRMPL